MLLRRSRSLDKNPLFQDGDLLLGSTRTRYFIAAILSICVCAAAFAQVMTPNIVPPGGIGQMNPNQGDMTANPPVQQGTVITCQGTGYNFTLSCNSQYIVVL